MISPGVSGIQFTTLSCQERRAQVARAKKEAARHGQTVMGSLETIGVALLLGQ